MSGAVQLFAVVSRTPLAGPCLQALPDPVDASNAHEGFEQLGITGGVYTAFRTFERERFVGLDEHLDRTVRSMELLGWPEAETALDRNLIRRGLAEAVAQREDDSMVRLDVLPPGTTVGGEPGTRLVLTLAPLHRVPERFLREGVRVELASELARDQPRIKTAEFVLQRRPYPLGSQEAFEHLLLDAAGNILEATSANVYVVLDGVVYTAGDGVLEGITRLLCLRVARAEGIEVREEAVSVAALDGAAEMFLTSSTRGVVPIVDVAGTVIGEGQPGPVTQGLARALATEIARIARPAWPVEGSESP